MPNLGFDCMTTCTKGANAITANTVERDSQEQQWLSTREFNYSGCLTNNIKVMPLIAACICLHHKHVETNTLTCCELESITTSVGNLSIGPRAPFRQLDMCRLVLV